jgi:MarR family transcriptional regulator, lower aerobic nicotinate degradation pathway regulator
MEKYAVIRSILDSLRRLVRELRVSSRRAEARSGLTAAQLFVLERVATNQPVSVNELAELTLTHQSSVSVVAQKLVERGFLEQRQAPQDRRRKELTITKVGRKALKRAPTSVQDRLIAAASTMGIEDQRTLERLLGMLTDAIGLQDSEPVLFFEKEPLGQERRIRRRSPTSFTKAKESP